MNDANEPYGVVPDRQPPSTSPYAAFAQQAPPPGRQQTDYPYLNHGQAAVPTQPVAQHLSNIGQPANRIAADSTGADPYSTGPTAHFPRYVPSLSPAPVPAAPRRFTQSQPPGALRQAATSTPWRRDRVIALITTLIACGTVTIWTIIDASKQPFLRASEAFTLIFFLRLFFQLVYALGAWWLALMLLSARAIYENRPSVVMAATTLQLFLIDVLIFSNSNSTIRNPLIIPCLLVTGGAAAATTIMSQHTPNPRPWPITLGLAVNLFVLISMLHQLTMMFLGALQGDTPVESTFSLWLANARGQQYPGIPFGIGIILMIIAAAVAGASLYLGSRHPYKRTFVRLAGIAPMILSLTNMVVLSVYKISSASITSAFGLTSVARGSFQHAYLRSWCASILLAVITIGVAVMLYRQPSAGSRAHAAPAPSSAGASQYRGYRPYMR